MLQSLVFLKTSHTISPPLHHEHHRQAQHESYRPTVVEERGTLGTLDALDCAAVNAD